MSPQLRHVGRGASSEWIMPNALYTVQPADERGGLLELARCIYGSAELWTRIFEANHHIIGNNPNVLRAGQQLALPGLAERRAGPRCARAYTVVPDDLPDGLAGIARRVYGSAERWEELYRVNRGVIGENPQLLQPGQRLLILAP
jgi:nucleoid-associated protein YgaU